MQFPANTNIQCIGPQPHPFHEEWELGKHDFLCFSQHYMPFPARIVFSEYASSPSWEESSWHTWQFWADLDPLCNFQQKILFSELAQHPYLPHWGLVHMRFLCRSGHIMEFVAKKISSELTPFQSHGTGGQKTWHYMQMLTFHAVPNKKLVNWPTSPPSLLRGKTWPTSPVEAWVWQTWVFCADLDISCNSLQNI